MNTVSDGLGVSLVGRSPNDGQFRVGIGGRQPLDERFQPLSGSDVADEHHAQRSLLCAVLDRPVVEVWIELVAGGRCDDGRFRIDTEAGNDISGRRAVTNCAVDRSEIPALDGAVQR